MKQEILEYKDQQNWFVGQFGEKLELSGFFGKQGGFERTRLASLLEKLYALSGLEEGDDPCAPQIHLIQKDGDDFAFLSFVVEMLQTRMDQQWSVRRHRGALLVLAGDRVLHLELPDGEMTIEQLFGQGTGQQYDFGETILIATKNEGKTKEFRAFFERLGYQVENLNQYPELSDVEETGMTFEENARLKAETISNETGKIVLADDSGLKVDALGGLPGVWSARFSGPQATDAKNNAKLLHELAMVFETEKRSAQFHCTLVVACPGRDSLVVEADWPGYIATAPKGDNGFGYDPIFLVGETGRTSAELTVTEKNQQSHRAKALEKLMEEFPKWQAQQN
ncbi:nucleoside-triphosphate diphosphatase [Streptococcus sp. DD13]|uniref:nucleoside-triphosphate diphosphatase n=1 Tax=Streptococcus sp. DD13 TaxID=1777881 RepID=UPI00079B04FA|nr:nucleoside-triphosphate diphosphatase [Streptococcus sp. DD13]KXT78188.1 Nucleoside 5-triphosphatase RdgB (dHAPTP, dITP, XTP-specific) [Streptococcus sp. DD13]